MNVLLHGPVFGTWHGEVVRHFVSGKDHAVRSLATTSGADYTYAPLEDAAAIVERIAMEWPTDLLMCWFPEVCPPPLGIESCPVPTVALVSDWTVYYPQVEHNAARYDLLVTDRLGARVLQPPEAVPRFFGPLYSQRTGLHRKLDIPRDIDIAFAGNLNSAVHARRGGLLDTVAALSDRYRVAIASGLPAEEYTCLLNRTRIAFNYGLRREMNLRCFEAPACGALLFIEEENFETRDFLRDGEEAVYYRPDNLVARLEHFLSHPEECGRIAEQGHARIMRLAGECRLDGLIEATAAAGPGARAFRALPECERMLAEVLQYASSPVPEQRRHAAETAEAAEAAFPGEPRCKLAAGCLGLERLARAGEDERRAVTQSALESFREAASLAPETAVPWLNLAFACRHAKSTTSERRFLELALKSSSAEFGAYLLGERRDRHYAIFRESLAYGKTELSQLHAAAAARLAQIHLDAGDPSAASELAEQSLGWEARTPDAFRLLGEAEMALGNFEAAAAHLEAGLAYTSLDSNYRGLLVGLYRRLGRSGDAEALAAESRHIFEAWWGAEHVAGQFT